MKIVVGTRGSPLALAQSRAVMAQLAARHHGQAFELCVISTTGDTSPTIMPMNDTVGIFVKELEEALATKRIDLAVHSLKDIPVRQPDGLVIGAVCEREDPRDAWVGAKGVPFKGMKVGSMVGTSSPRRRFQLQALRPDLDYRDIKGNVDTRLAKVDRGEYQAAVLACAGLNRLGLTSRITEYFSPEEVVPAPGQGAVALEIRKGDKVIQDVISAVHHQSTADAVAAERACLAGLGGGCRMPIGALATAGSDGLSLLGVLAGEDGVRMVKHRLPASRLRPEALGQQLSEALQVAFQREA